MGDFNCNPLIGYSASLPWVRGETNVDAVNHWTEDRPQPHLQVRHGRAAPSRQPAAGSDLWRERRPHILRGHYFLQRIIDCTMQRSISGRAQQPPPLPPISATRWPASCSMCPARSGATSIPTSRVTSQWWIFAFGGDKWQVTPKLTLDLGLRWELYPPATPGTAQGFSNYNPTNNTLVHRRGGRQPQQPGHADHYNYFAPRLGFAYRLSEKTVVRGGFGISYTPFEDNTYAYNYPVRANNGYTAANAYMPASLNTSTVACSSVQTYFTYSVRVPGAGCGRPFPRMASFKSASGSNTLNAAVGVLHPAQLSQPVCGFVERRSPAGSCRWQWNAQLSYVGNHGTRMGVGQNINLANALNLGSAGYPLNIAFGKTAVGHRGLPGLFDELCLAAGRVEPSLHGQPGRDHVVHLGQRPELRYGSGDDDGGLIFWLDQRHSYGPTDFDHRFNFEESVTWILPFGPHQKWLNSGPVASILGGWQLSGVVSAYSGLPFNVTASGTSINTSGDDADVEPHRQLPRSPGHWSRDTTGSTPAAFSQPTGCTGAVGTACPLVYGTSIGNVSQERVPRTGIHSEQRIAVRRPSPCTKTGRSISAAMRSSSPTRRSSPARPTPSPAEPLGRSPAR